MLAQPETAATTPKAESLGQDQVVLLYDATWADYERLLEIRGEGRVPRLAYLEGVVELMVPSKEHEGDKSMIGCLVEVWCLEHGVDFMPYGSWTLGSKTANRGAEPDECYVFGKNETPPERPDLAIEVIRTSGGLDKRRIYEKLGVRELWFWRAGRFTVYVLRGSEYEERPHSELLPGLDLEQLASFLDRPTASQAMREYAAALRAQKVS